MTTVAIKYDLKTRNELYCLQESTMQTRSRSSAGRGLLCVAYLTSTIQWISVYRVRGERRYFGRSCIIGRLISDWPYVTGVLTLGRSSFFFKRISRLRDLMWFLVWSGKIEQLLRFKMKKNVRDSAISEILSCLNSIRKLACQNNVVSLVLHINECQQHRDCQNQ